jgi:cytoskeletal protein CcmA (bactofilin family)
MRIRKAKPPKVVTVIGEGTTIEGQVHFSGALHLDGKIKGKVNGEPDTDATLIISEQGMVEGDVEVAQLITDGRIEGDVRTAERVELGNHARIKGTVYYQLLEMAMGAEVNGELVHRDTLEPQKLGYDGHQPEALLPDPPTTDGDSIPKNASRTKS